MNPRAIQRAVVRMLYDPDFVAAIHGARALPGLSEAERALLRRVDPRAFATDPFRRARAVQAIVEEFPCSAAAVGLARVEAFLATREFLACLGDGGSMGLAFATWLEDQAAGAGRIEAAMARLRRPMAESPPLVAGTLRCAVTLAPIVVPAGSLAWYEATRAWLGATPLHTLAERADQAPRAAPPRRSPVRSRDPGEEQLLIEISASGEMSLGTASEALVRLLRHAQRARTRRELEREAVIRGAAADESAGVIDDLLAQGLLVAG
ncbi:hypothetical protein [Nannocystis sp.]|uniref:hypothetical protein n=1 Tax=Nannocystis sp. TaxID=1962667 RepID=UPI0025F389A8|nr:hypothetical protein [Nannocystis sp.]MBK7830602.1 hypothetical protein [Nannocystis sp.]